jgi:N-acetylmuramoyl-L-alanine amidase
MTPQQNYELALLALCIWREASGAGADAMLGVAWSIRNRALNPAWYGIGYAEVITKKYQYSSMSAPGDPNLIRWPLVTDPSWASALNIASVVYEGFGSDPTQGSINYYSTDIAPPSWVAAMTFTVQIGPFKFFK